MVRTRAQYAREQQNREWVLERNRSSLEYRIQKACESKSDKEFRENIKSTYHAVDLIISNTRFFNRLLS